MNTKMHKALPAMLIGAGLIATVTLAQHRSGSTTQFYRDTIPSKEEPKDINDVLRQLDAAKAEVDKALYNIDWKRIDADIKTSLKDIDAAGLKREIDAAVKGIDAASIKRDVAAALASLDKEKLKADIKQADLDEIQANVKAAVAQIDIDKIKADLDKVKGEIDLKQLNVPLDKLKPEIEKSIAEAHKSIEAAKAEMQVYKALTDGLAADGLIGKDAYKIAYKGGRLSINGKEQPASVNEKYRQLLKDKKDFIITKDKKGFNITTP